MPDVSFIIDTDSYSGNFFREIVAYCTGITRDGSEDLLEKIEFETETGWNEDSNPFFGIQRWEFGEYGEMPSEIQITPGWNLYCFGSEEPKAYQEENAPSGAESCFPSYQSVAIFFDEVPDQALIACIKDRAHKFAAKYPGDHVMGEPMKILGFRVCVKQVILSEIAI